MNRMDFDFPVSQREQFVFNKLAATSDELGMEVYLIGGYLRDKLLGRPTKDIDLLTVGDGLMLARKIAERFQPKPPVSLFKTYGTAQIKLPDLEIEVVGARKESYSENSRKPDVVAGTLQDDLERRDFTINTLYTRISTKYPDSGIIQDPFNGLTDLKFKVIRTPLEPAKTFSDDPLRMLRAIRFATQLQFTIEQSALEGIIKEKERIRIISGERIADELNKIMLATKPSIGWDLLFRTGLLDIIFPQLTALAGAENMDGIGHKDNFYHSIQVLDNIAPHTRDLWLRWAALLHDIGKPATKRFEKGHGWTFHGHEMVGAKMVPKIFAQLKLPLNEKMRYVQKLVSLHMRPVSLTKENITDSAIRRLLFDGGAETDDLMTLCEADITSKNAAKVKRFRANFELVRKRMEQVEESDKMRNWQPPVSGDLIMQTFGISPGREVGIIKDHIRESIIDGVIANSYEEAYQLMLKKGQELGLRPVDGERTP
ncbi:CCA tRNA nucleotidyltransferase [Arachidicoccus terrestris]|uniref:CCA tRNA nucleotidyltransferase n=1 Tax=Arachidicoccus terrestris TaxID=2875539 RepID=UPI001CC44095|nr:HD domain-containing protein [Arachidicoccus terrestris]